MKRFYSGFKLSDADRNFLLDLFPPKYPVVRCEHVTVELTQGAAPDMPYPYPMSVIGYVDSGFMEVLAVEVNGKALRQDGELYHVTHSYQPGHESREAGTVIRSFDIQQKHFVGIGGEPFIRVRRA